MLRQFTITIWAWFLAAMPVQAAIELTAPKTIEPGEHVQVMVSGIADEDLPKAIAKQWPREGTTWIPAKTWGQDAMIIFAAKVPGEYLLFVACGEDYGEAVITVGESDVNPIPTPLPPEKLSVVVLYESATRTPQESIALSKIRNYAETQPFALFRMEDVDLTDGRTGEPPAWLKPYRLALASQQVPAVLIGRHVGGSFKIDAKPLPLGNDGNDAVELLRRIGQ